MRIGTAILIVLLAAGCAREPIDDRLVATADDIDRAPDGCGRFEGAWDDLAIEPVEWLDSGQYIRWEDTAGCPVRVDVLAHVRGSERCGWEDVDLITIGVPIGTSIDGGERRTYFWDPTGVLDEVPLDARSEMVSLDRLPETVLDTGLRLDGRELWLDELDPSAVYRLVGDDAEVWRLDRSDQIVCA